MTITMNILRDVALLPLRLRKLRIHLTDEELRRDLEYGTFDDEVPEASSSPPRVLSRPQGVA